MTDRPAPALVDIDGQALNVENLAQAVDLAMERLAGGRGFTLFTLNLDHVVKRREDVRFRDAYGRATFVTADGAPIVWLARRQGVQLSRATGADLVVPLCAAAARKGVKVALFGSSPAALENAARALRSKCPGLDICFQESPPQGFDPFSSAARAAAARIAASGARLCLVALGAPKQEFFCDQMAMAHRQIGFLGIGAALDFLSGDQKRAPELLQRTGLEWAWRLGNSPRRLGARYARCALALADMAILAPLRRRLRAPAVSGS